MITLLAGMTAGGMHVFAGPDHLAALTPIAVKSRSDAGRTGASWGLGHGLGVVIIGALGLTLRSFIEVEAWAGWAEWSVGFMLLGIGAWSAFRARGVTTHVHTHDHGAGEHEHVHTHASSRLGHNHAALGVGMLHGMAGSGHLFGVLPALGLPTGLAVVYLGSYLVAAVVAMGVFAFGLGALLGRGGPIWVQRAMVASGVIAIAIGVLWIYLSWPS